MKFCRNAVRGAGVILLSFLLLVPMAAAQQPSASDLQRLIEKQQQQIDTQAKEIEALKQQMDKTVQKAEKAEVSAVQAQTLVPEPPVARGQKKVEVKLYGQVNRGLLYVDDGEKNQLFSVDNKYSDTRIGILGNAKITDDLSVGSWIEVQFESNSSYTVNQFSEDNSANNFTKRHLELWFDSQRFGKLYMGWGNTATKYSAQQDLSGTTVIDYSAVRFFAGGVYFHDPVFGYDDKVRVKDVFHNFDGLGRINRVRYDTPHFAGFYLAASYDQDDQHDIALWYRSKFPMLQIAGALGYAKPKTDSEVDNQYDGSVSVLLNNGLNVTLAAGTQDMKDPTRDDPKSYFGKLGYQFTVFPIGKTAVAADYAKHKDIERNGDDADSFGLVGVQNIDKLGTEVYLGYRYYNLDRKFRDYDTVNAVMAGARVKF